ncbi:MAG: WYL domain-containing protein, partial [Erysipelotrichaceae bacterium]|nr:WYL domain-containing protein [Erysipelotrichaceae bacterium]
MAVFKGKLRTLYIMKILLEQTDEKNVLSAKKILELLDNCYGIAADRKSVYADVELLQEYGLDILQKRGKNSGFYIGSREFEVAELKLLVDAVQTSKFITSDKSNKLIEKLQHLTSEESAKQLQRQVYIEKRLKSENEKIYYNVDYLHRAINEKKQIEFKYLEWTVNGLQFRRNGAFYVESPWALVWDDEYYYLVAYEEASDKIKYFRVDKMEQVSVLEDKDSLGEELFNSFDSGEFSKKTFGMFQGNDQQVKLRCKKDKLGIIRDRFGSDVEMKVEDEHHVSFEVMVSLSSQFYGWLTGVGKEV